MEALSKGLFEERYIPLGAWYYASKPTNEDKEYEPKKCTLVRY